MNCEDRDPLGIYKVSNGGGPGPDVRRGPGPVRSMSRKAFALMSSGRL
jgi:hypothetical protein